MKLCFFLIYTHSILVYYSFRHQARLLARQIYFGCCGMRRILVREEDPRSRPRISPAPAPHRPVLSRSVLAQVLVLCSLSDSVIRPSLQVPTHVSTACIYYIYLPPRRPTTQPWVNIGGTILYRSTVERLESSTRLRGFAPFPTCWTLG